MVQNGSKHLQENILIELTEFDMQLIELIFKSIVHINRNSKT